MKDLQGWPVPVIWSGGDLALLQIPNGSLSAVNFVTYDVTGKMLTEVAFSDGADSFFFTIRATGLNCAIR